MYCARGEEIVVIDDKDVSIMRILSTSESATLRFPYPLGFDFTLNINFTQGLGS